MPDRQDHRGSTHLLLLITRTHTTAAIHTHTHTHRKGLCTAHKKHTRQTNKWCSIVRSCSHTGSSVPNQCASHDLRKFPAKKKQKFLIAFYSVAQTHTRAHAHCYIQPTFPTAVEVVSEPETKHGSQFHLLVSNKYNDSLR